MTEFWHRSATADGRQETGRIMAGSETEAAALLRRQGLVPLSRSAPPRFSLRDLLQSEVALSSVPLRRKSRRIPEGVEILLNAGPASVLRAVFSQRLLSQLCPTCRAEAAPLTGSNPDDAFAAIRQVQPSFIAKECDACDGTRRAGRAVIAEVMPVTGTIREVISMNAEAAKIAEASKLEQGARFAKDALRLVQEGRISREDALAVLTGL